MLNSKRIHYSAGGYYSSILGHVIIRAIRRARSNPRNMKDNSSGRQRRRMSNSSDDTRKREIGSPSHSFSVSLSSLSRWFVEYSGPSRCRRADCCFCLAWMDRSESSPAAKYREICSPRNGSLNIGHRGGGARIPDTSTRISTDSGIIPLAWSIVYIGHRLASDASKQPA